jgi:hypothetical protein
MCHQKIDAHHFFADDPNPIDCSIIDELDLVIQTGGIDNLIQRYATCQ